ncbi:MAG: hypothetical protein FJ109_19435 [Deltaproteobacteria bacterium]|nr:hypothetical protein [Deltaproteobacteria bacterium]
MKTRSGHPGRTGDGHVGLERSVLLLLLPAALVLAACVDIEGAVDRRSDLKTGAIGNSIPQDRQSADASGDLGPVEDAGNPGAADLDSNGGRADGHLDAGDRAGLDANAPAFDSAGGEVGDAGPEDIDVDLCTPDCEGKNCGSDGCGGVCGYCPQSKPICTFGECKACKPDCGAFECGPDGCGGTCGKCPSKFACIGGFCKAPACAQQQTLLLESFDACTQGIFDIVDFEPDDSVTWWALPLKNYSPPCALFLGDPETLTYDTAAGVHLKLLSPEVSLAAGIAWRLTIRLFFELEPVPSPLYPYDYDVLYLRFVEQPGGKEIDLWSTKEDLNSSGSEMKLLNLDLSALAGLTGRFELEFDTVDSIANDYPGIYLDDFRLDVICPYCGSPEECSDGEACTLDSCEAFDNFPDVGGCWQEPIPDCS